MVCVKLTILLIVLGNLQREKFVTTTADEYNMTAGDKQTNSLKCTYVVEKEDSVTWDKEELMWSREDKRLSARHKANNSVLVIENTEWTDIGPYTCSVKLTRGGVGNPSFETVSTMVPLNDTTVASASTSYVNSSNEPTVGGSTVQYRTNATTTDSNGGTTKPVTQNVMTTEASTPNPEGETVYHGNGSGWCIRACRH